jgi:hypothetical protein
MMPKYVTSSPISDPRILAAPDGETGSRLSYKEKLKVQFLLGQPSFAKVNCLVV